jgi:hypothetical protein
MLHGDMELSTLIKLQQKNKSIKNFSFNFGFTILIQKSDGMTKSIYNFMNEME